MVILSHLSSSAAATYTPLSLPSNHDDPSTTIGVLPHRQWPIL